MKTCRQSLFPFALLACLTSLGGCLPAPLGKYYKPYYPDSSATYSGDACGGKAGAPAALTLALADGVSLSINAWRSYGEKSRLDRPLHISLQLPKDVRLQFLSDEIRVGGKADDEGQKISAPLDIFASVMLDSDQFVDLQKIAPTPFPNAGAGPAVDNFSATTALYFSWQDNFVPSELAMDLPAIVVEGQKPMPPIRLLARAKKRLETYPGQYQRSSSLIYTTEESERALALKYARCTKETPERKCDNIPRYDDGRFSLEQQGFQLSGRWYVFDVEKHTPFSGELVLRYQAPVKWKFASNQIRITDLASQAERVYRFTQFALHFGYQVPLTTPIRGVNEAPYSDSTKVSINASLGSEELPKYFIRLPPLLINGKTYRLAPIELEKRSLDIGLQRFNC